MTKEKLFEILSKDQSIPFEKTEALEKLYTCSLPEEIRRLISIPESDLFLEDAKRVLSYSEILNASKELQVDFIKLNIIPLIDCCDNDFIVYSVQTQRWSMFNIADEVLFMTRMTLTELL